MSNVSVPSGRTSAQKILEHAKNEIIDADGPWTMHNIQLGLGVSTMETGRNFHNWKWERCHRVIKDIVQRPFTELRILDLGCMEGLYSIELAKLGAEVTGVDIAEGHLRKANFAKQALGLLNVEFHRDDVRNVAIETYGAYDIVLMNGILHLLDAPDLLRFLERISELTTHTLYIDTPVSVEKVSGLETKNFALTLPSLLIALETTGFTSVYRCDVPRNPDQGEERAVVVARRGN